MNRLIHAVSVTAIISVASLSAQDRSWQTALPNLGMAEVELGNWSALDATDKWGLEAGTEGTNEHAYPKCYMLKTEWTDAKADEGYILRDIDAMFGKDGLLRDNQSNLDRLIKHPLLKSDKLVYEANGGPIDVDFFFGSGDFGNRLCYFYVPPTGDYSGLTDEMAMVKAFAANEVPTFCVANQMRTSEHFSHFKNENGNWMQIDDTDPMRNDHLGTVLGMENFGGWGDYLVKGKTFRLKYFGDDYAQEPTDEFPEGTKIYFFLLTYNKGDNLAADESVPYSIKFATNTLNAQFGNQGRWWINDETAGEDYKKYNNQAHKEYSDKYQAEYGNGVFAAAAVDYSFYDSNAGKNRSMMLLSWEDWVQPTADGSVGDFDMNDVTFVLSGVKLVDDSESQIDTRLNVAQHSEYDVKNNKNNLRHWLDVLNDEEHAKNPIRSKDLQPVVFSDGNLLPSYTWVAQYYYRNDSDERQLLDYIVLRKSVVDTYKNQGAYTFDDQVNPDLKYKIEYAFYPEYTESVENVTGFKELQEDFTRGTDDNTVLKLVDMTPNLNLDPVIGSEDDLDSYVYQMLFRLNRSRNYYTNRSTVYVPHGEIISELRGTTGEIDRQNEDLKHVGKYEDLKLIDNRTFVTLRFDKTYDGKGVEKIKRLSVIDGEGKELCWVNHEDNNGWTVSNNEYSIVGESQDETGSYIVLASPLTPGETVYGQIETQFTDRHGDVKTNKYGIGSAVCYLPELSLDVTLTAQYQRRPSALAEHPFIYSVETNWTINGDVNPEDVQFNQWRSYNKKHYEAVYGEDEASGEVRFGDNALMNILHGKDAKTGSIPAENYLSWMKEFHNGADNSLENSNGSWTNKDILAQRYDGKSDVTAEYTVRAYINSRPSKLPVTRAVADQSLVVLEAKASATGRQHATTTGVDDVIVDADVTPIYYNLQGVRVDNPVKGRVYIVVRGDETSKEIVK